MAHTKVTRYLRQADNNVKVAGILAQARPHRCQWAVVCLFYAGLHYVNAYLHHTTGSVPEKHRERGNKVSRLMRSVYTEYAMLKDASEEARYSLRYHKPRQFRLLEKDLRAIETFVRSALPTK